MELEVEVVYSVLERCRAGTTVTFGAPTRCPGCGDFGFIDHVDPVEQATWNRCLTCGNTWVITRRALAAVRQRGWRAPSPRVVPDIVEPSHPSRLLTHTSMPEPAALGSSSAGVAPLVDVERESERDLRRAARYVHALPDAVGQEGARDVQPDVRRSRLEPTGAEKVETSGIRAERLKLLLVEDDPSDAELVRTVLQPYSDQGVSVVHAETRTEGERIVGNHEDIDLVLLDLGLPDSNGLSTLARWRSRPTPPVVVVSGNDNPGLADATRRLGAALYVHKHELIDLTHQGADHLVASFRELTLTAAE